MDNSVNFPLSSKKREDNFYLNGPPNFKNNGFVSPTLQYTNDQSSNVSHFQQNTFMTKFPPNPQEMDSCHPIYSPTYNSSSYPGRFSSQPPFQKPCYLSGPLPKYFSQPPPPPAAFVADSEVNYFQIPPPTNSHLPFVKDQTFDADWVKWWMDVVSTEKNHKSSVKITDVQELLLKHINCIIQLKQLHKNLSECTEEKWKFDFDKAEIIKGELCLLSRKLKDPNFISEVKSLVCKRRSKRKRMRLSKKRNKQHKQSIRREREHKIDTWRQKLIEEEDVKIQNAKMKKEADSILGEVRSKQEEAIQLKNLLKSLHKLRQARLTKGIDHGYHSSSDSDARFHLLTNKLETMLDVRLELYKKEEQTLRVMMDESLSLGLQRTTSKCKQKNIEQYTKEIREIYFGSREVPSIDSFYKFCTSAEESLDVLVQRRNEWDQFLVPEDTPMSSGIPVGWVLPPISPNKNWNSYQMAAYK